VSASRSGRSARPALLLSFLCCIFACVFFSPLHAGGTIHINLLTHLDRASSPCLMAGRTSTPPCPAWRAQRGWGSMSGQGSCRANWSDHGVDGHGRTPSQRAGTQSKGCWQRVGDVLSVSNVIYTDPKRSAWHSAALL